MGMMFKEREQNNNSTNYKQSCLKQGNGHQIPI